MAMHTVFALFTIVVIVNIVHIRATLSGNKIMNTMATAIIGMKEIFTSRLDDHEKRLSKLEGQINDDE